MNLRSLTPSALIALILAAAASATPKSPDVTTSIPLTGAELAQARAAQTLKRAEAAKVSAARPGTAQVTRPPVCSGSKPPSVGTAVPVPTSGLNAALRQKLAQTAAAQTARGVKAPAPARTQEVKRP